MDIREIPGPRRVADKFTDTNWSPVEVGRFWQRGYAHLVAIKFYNGVAWMLGRPRIECAELHQEIEEYGIEVLIDD